MWTTATERLALLELLVLGRLRKRRAQASCWDLLAELPWTRRTGRRDELSLVEHYRHELVALLERVWPEWGGVLAELTARGLDTTPEGWARLDDARRATGLPELPARLNRRTAAALVAPHSKAALTERRISALGKAKAMHDGSVRLRPPDGFIAVTRRGRVNLSAVASVLGEVSVSERAFSEGLTFEGPVATMLMIENLGVFCDLRAPAGWLLVHVPGWDTATASLLLERLAQVPVVHFGDLDPNGVRIVNHLRRARPSLQWFVPDFWAELVGTKALMGVWPDDVDVAAAPALVRDLASRGLWLEQEPLALDPRTFAALEALR